MKTVDKIGTAIRDFIWNHPTKTVFILGFVTGFIIKSLL
jgi:hypothetical protein